MVVVRVRTTYGYGSDVTVTSETRAYRLKSYLEAGCA